MDFWTGFGLVKRVDFGLELGRGPIAEGGVLAVIVIVGVNKVKNLCACVRLIEEASALEHFVFKSAHHGCPVNSKIQF